MLEKEILLEYNKMKSKLVEIQEEEQIRSEEEDNSDSPRSDTDGRATKKSIFNRLNDL